MAHTHTYTTHMCRNGGGLSLFTVVGMHYSSSHERIVCKSGQKVTRWGSVRVVLYAPGSTNTGRIELTNSGNQTATGTKGKATETIPSIPHSTVKQASSHVDEVCSPTTAHMRPRQLKPQPHGPPGLCELPLPHSLPLHSHITR